MSEEESYESSSNEVGLLAPVHLAKSRLSKSLVWELCLQPLRRVPQSGDQARV